LELKQESQEAQRTTMRKVVGLGELLWDLFPSGRKLGGAPANFAYISNLLEDHGIVASRVGNDELGREATHRVNALGVETREIQEDASHATGMVKVSLDAAGQAKFEITESVAWDYLEWTPEWRELAKSCAAVCFGSLAQRATQSRGTIQAFVREARQTALCIFDVNLRQAFYCKETLERSMELAHIVKLNHEELPVVSKLLGNENADEKQTTGWLRDKFELELVCVTRGSQGSLMWSATETHEHPGFQVKIVDTVGAGDAFTAAMTHHFLRGSSLAAMSEAANRVGAWVASQAGGTPVPDEETLHSLRA
jgi:fructokinase